LAARCGEQRVAAMGAVDGPLAVWAELRRRPVARPATVAARRPAPIQHAHARRSLRGIDFGDITRRPATDLQWPGCCSHLERAVPLDRDRCPHLAASGGWALNLALAYLTGNDSTSMPASAATLAAVLTEFG
jgi:hypothetical protein